MSSATIKLLSEFEALPHAEKQEFVRELLKRSTVINLGERGIDTSQAEDLRARLKTFAEDWNRPEAAIYDEDTAR